MSVAFHVSTAKPGAQVPYIRPCSKDMPRDISFLISSNGKRHNYLVSPLYPLQITVISIYFKEANTTHPQILRTVLETNLVPCDCLQMDNFPELGHLASLLKYGIRSGSWQGSLAGPIILRNGSMRMENTFARLMGKGFQISGWTEGVTLGPLIENTRMGLECLGGMTVPHG